MRLQDLPTPSLILDRSKLLANLARMRKAVGRHPVGFRPHLKTAKSVDVAHLAFGGGVGPITVSTLAEAEYFAQHGFRSITLAAAIPAHKLDRAARVAAIAGQLALVTDDVETAAAMAAHPGNFKVLVEIDCGERRGGILPDDSALPALGRALGSKFAGVLTHAGHSYLTRTIVDVRRVAEQERRAAVLAAERLREAGLTVGAVSVGSTPTAMHAERLDGVTEVRAGVYMFGDLFQAELGSHTREDIALTVLTSVIGRRPAENRVILDAGALALSKDRSTAQTMRDVGFGLVWDLAGRESLGVCTIERAYQEHGVATSDRPLPFGSLPVGARLRVAPNHACLTAAAYDRYYVTDGGDEIVAEYDRINGW
jgi:D-serine deaminase-like pyridoxal phosphate-dependent protein